MENNKEKISKLSQEEEENVSGGYIVQVDPKDLKEMHLDFKPYLVVSKSGCVECSYETKEEAMYSDYWLRIGQKGDATPNCILKKGDLKGKIFTNGKGEFYFIDR